MENGFIDLTLRLGPPNSNYRESYENPIHFRNFDLNSPLLHQEIEHGYGLSEENSYFNISNNSVANYTNNYNATSYGNSNNLGGQIIINNNNVGRCGGRGSTRGRPNNYYKNGEDANRRCTNCGCGSNDTPMWRRGPLGLKTLCNACGIRYRKEELKRKEGENHH